MTNSQFIAKDPAYAQRVRASFGRQGAMKLIGAAMTELAPGYCAVSLVPRPEVAQLHGYVHAGIIATLVDSAGGYAGFTVGEKPGGKRTLVALMQQTLIVMHGKAES